VSLSSRSEAPRLDDRLSVMPGLVPGIHLSLSVVKTWMAGTSPAMTIAEGACQSVMPGLVPGIHVFVSAVHSRMGGQTRPRWSQKAPVSRHARR
jgi:hypothetical protein